MIKIENTEVVGWEHAIRGMRNPKNSWDKSDSGFCKRGYEDCKISPGNGYCPKNGEFDGDFYCVGENDLQLMQKLCKAGTDHRKFMRMIVVYADITAPLYWWKEFDTYKVGTVANSCSTMHKIHEKEFTLDDFSCEHLMDDYINRNSGEKLGASQFGSECFVAKDVMKLTIDMLNVYRNMFINTNDKRYWWQMIQLLPSSYNQKRTVMLNYEVLANMYKPTSRRYHKQDEWNVNCVGSLCSWIETLPHSELIIGKGV